MTFTLTDLVQGHCTPLTNKLCKGKILAKLGLKGEYIYALKIWIFVWSDMTLTLHLQISFEVIAYILIKGIMWVKYEAEWSKGREDILRTRIFKNIILLWPSQFLFTENRFKVTTHPFTLYSKALLMWSLSQIGVSRNYICSQKRIFAWSDMIFTRYLEISCKVTAHRLTIETLCEY